MSSYRGKDKKNNWRILPNFVSINGYSYLSDDDGFITKFSDSGLMAVRGELIEVIPSSVGVNTNKKDKNNKQIFTGDVLRVSTTVDQTTTNVDYLVEVSDGGYIASAITDGAEDSTLSTEFLASAAIVGNSTDNPSLVG